MNRSVRGSDRKEKGMCVLETAWNLVHLECRDVSGESVVTSMSACL